LQYINVTSAGETLQLAMSSSVETNYRSAFLVFLCLVISVIRYLTYHSSHTLSSLGLHSYLIAWSAGLESGNNAALRGAHQTYLLSLAPCIFFVPKIRQWFHSAVEKTSLLTVLAKLFGILSVLFCGSAFLYWTTNAAALCFGLFVVFSFLCLPVSQREIIFKWPAFKPLLISMCVMAVVPGLLIHLSLKASTPADIANIQSHYSVVVAQGDGLAYGQKMFENVRPYYGILLPLLTGLYERYISELNFNGFVFLLKILELTCLFCALALFVAFARGWNLASALALCLLLPWLHTNNIGFLYPNNISFRWLGLVAAVATLFYVRRFRGARLALSLGIAGGLNVLWNLEVGIAVLIGFLAFLSLRENMFRAGSSMKIHYPLFNFCLGLIIPLMIFILTIFLVEGSWPNFAPFIKGCRMIAKLVSGGYSAQPFVYNPIAILMIVHMSYAALVIGARAGAGSFRNCMRYSIAAMSLVWFAYYLNKPDFISLNSEFFLYGFFLIDLLRQLYLRSMARRSSAEPALLLMAVLCLVVLPQVFDGFHSATPLYKAAIYRLMHREKDKTSMKLSGVELPIDIAYQLQDKADFIKALNQKSPVTYFTSNTVLIPKLSAVRSNIPYRDVFAEMPLNSQSDEMCANLVKNGPKELFFDDPAISTSGDGLRLSCFKYIQERITPTYKLADTAHGWQRWSRL